MTGAEQDAGTAKLARRFIYIETSGLFNNRDQALATQRLILIICLCQNSLNSSYLLNSKTKCR